MALAKILATLEGLDEKYTPLYTKNDDGAYVLNIEIDNTGEPDLTGLKSKNTELLDKNIKLKQRLDALETEEEKRADKKLLDDKEFDTLLTNKEAKWQTKLDEANGRLETLQKQTKNTLLEVQANKIANTLFGEDADVFMSQVKSRLTTIEKDGNFEIQILDINGNASTLTDAQLIEEFKGNTKLQKFIVGRDSSGGDAGGGSGNLDKGTKYDNYYDESHADYSPTKQGELQDENPTLHAKLVEKFGLNDISTAIPQRAMGRR